MPNIYLVTVYPWDGGHWYTEVEAASNGTAIRRVLANEKEDRQERVSVDVKLLHKNMTMEQYREKTKA